MTLIVKTARNTPPHWFVSNATYMLTGVTYHRIPVLRSNRRKTQWRDAFHKAADVYDWHVIAWVVLRDHYHVLVKAPEDASSLSKFVGSYHKYTARLWNDEDGTPGRKVWWNYWDTCIRSEPHFYRCLQYVFWNPIKHDLAESPEDYEFSSYREFLAQGYSLDFTDVEKVDDVREP